jgi:ubiquinone/menaquinone biosynthesis C-methylase UbiE
MQFNEFKKSVQLHFDELATARKSWKEKNHYYYHSQADYLKFLIPPGKRLLELGCGTGDLLDELKPSRGVGIDISSLMVSTAQEAYPHLTFIAADAEDSDSWELNEVFDYIIISDTIGLLEDIQTTLAGLHQFCDSTTRIVISYYNFLWEPILRFGEKIGLKMPQFQQNWLSMADISNLLYLADFQVVKKETRLLFPKKIPYLSSFVNHYCASLPLIRKMCLSCYLVARPVTPVNENSYSTTIVIPCRNEKGNIEPAVSRIPAFGKHQEIIFVDGHSTDGTQEEIKRVIVANPEKDIKSFTQKGVGKGDAVRMGFHEAKGDILMILDADLTVPPEDLPKFYQALASGKGEFINGCRLVYPMEKQAMRFLNMLGNKFFGLAFSWLLNQRIKDTLCGTKVLFRKDYTKIAANRNYFGEFDPFGDFDLIFGASKLNLLITEVPIRYRDRAYGATNISRFRHGWYLLKMTAFAFKKFKIL